MQRLTLATKVWVTLGVVAFLAIVFSVQIFLSFRQGYTAAVSDEVTERSRAFTEQVKQTLEEQQSPTEQP
jgi:hypothetical protein